MKKLINLFSTVSLLFLFNTTLALASNSLVLFYDEIEMNTGSQVMRYIINNDFVRIDGGHASTDFILFDNKKKTIHSVNHEDRTVMKINNMPWKVPDYDFKQSEKINKLADAPKVFGKTVYSYQVVANDDVCTDVMLIKDTYMNEMKVMFEYQQVLSGQQVKTVNSTPEELRTPCFLVDQVYHSANYYKLGLPIKISYNRDYTKLLRDIRKEEFDQSLFELPENYEEYMPFFSR